MSDDSSQEEFELYVNKAEETRQWSALPWGGETLTDTKTRLRLDSLPRVLVFDRNLELITENGADAHIDSLAKKYLGKDKYPFRQPGEVRAQDRWRDFDGSSFG